MKMLIKRQLHISACLQFIRRPNFDVKGIISKLPSYVDSVKGRELVVSDELLSQLNQLQNKQQQIGDLNKEISYVQTRRKQIESEIKKDKSSIVQLKTELKNLKEKFQNFMAEQNSIKDSILETCLSLPNLVHPDVPKTDPEIVHWINPKAEYKPDPIRDHHRIMVKKHLVDFDTAASVTGTSWYYLINEGAMLEQALVQYACKKARSWGYKLCLPPSIVRNEVINACGFRPRDMNDERQIFHLSETKLGLTATAEIPLAALGLEKTIDIERSTPVVGVSRSYRAEAGSRGRDTKGLYRVHEFTKVELLHWAKPEESDATLEKLRAFQTEIITELGLSGKVLNMPMNDLGSPAYKKYDIEVWMPGRGTFGEVSSASNCTDYQSRRLNSKFEDKSTGKLNYVHTLNGTAMAVPRAIIAIVENFYEPSTERITIPKPLRPYMDNMEYI
ncbi:HFL180Wp [Eremothecium sinecaudum]|uniref:serine--tRNA ligase n=1 Tax=Eremothecium sinecaudum TaxID=45286 RepID=A0A120K2I5_9SACH|nr:HFL180Wp [Eremothecium sinecaudum]AMD21676.1 HFL180Wp [Eremothecium sinecaudum]